MGRLDGKVCIITGASSGIGAKTAEVFAREGACILIAARREDKLNAVAAKAAALGGEVTAVVTDIRDAEAVDKLYAVCMEKYGKLDVLVNNAGIIDDAFEPIDNYRDEDFEAIIDTNVRGTMRMTRIATDIFEKQKYGNVVTVASIAGLLGNGSAVYSASKGALVAMTKHTALRFADRDPNIRANCVCPATVWTDITKKAMAMKPHYSEKATDLNNVFDKHSTLEVGISKTVDAANLLLFLASDESACLNGQIITLDRGANL